MATNPRAAFEIPQSGSLSNGMLGPTRVKSRRPDPSLIVPGSALHLIDSIRLRREALKDPRNFTPLGKLIKINFDPAGMMSRPDPAILDHPVHSSNALEWIKDPGRRNQWGRPTDFPRLLISADDQDLMILSPIEPLPELSGPGWDDPSTWVPTDLPGWQIMRGNDPRSVGHMPQRFVQLYSDLTSDFIGESKRDGSPNFDDRDTFYVIQPVNQILMHPFDSSQQALVEPRAGIDGTHMAFLINPKSGEAHLIGGRAYVTNRIHSFPAGARP